LFLAIELIVNGWLLTGIALAVRGYNRDRNDTSTARHGQAEAKS